MIDKHAGVCLQGLGKGSQGKVTESVGEHIIYGLIAESGTDVGFGRSGHGMFFSS
jgi:hypothetical protein